MAFEKIKVANPIVEMDGEMRSLSLSLSLDFLSSDLFDAKMKKNVLHFTCLVFIEVPFFRSDLLARVQACVN